MKNLKWTFLNDLSGREWIPDGTVPGKPGWYEDVPRRVYVGIPWLFFTFDLERPWLKVEKRRTPPSRPH